MSRRSGRLTLQARDENAPEQNRVTRKRKSQPSKKMPSATKKQSYEIQNPWSKEGASPCALVETPHKELEPTADLSGFKQFRFKNIFIKPSPLPCLSWASSDDMWIKMLNKDLKYVHDKDYLLQHPNLQLKMRAILLDWLFEVSEVYCLHRQTAYLAQDFFDRFMVTQENVDKDCLQLIGITALFIASKIEEIYPPKVHEFAYVTDGACDMYDILKMELVMLKGLNWNLCPETAVSWLKLYSQVEAQKDGTNFLVPHFSRETYIQMTQLLDLCILDINSLDYTYGILAAAAFCHFVSYEVVHKVSGVTWDSVAPCVQWMSPFMDTVRALPRVELKRFDKVKPEDLHNIQTHADYLSMLNEAHHRQQDSKDRLSPVGIGGILTPPKSTEKPTSH
ncbi:G1/S-specific cyclin-E2 [Hypomesus transpacificus]|uniref:G1/S-specific cyclin-E2 n=1 Tax=Hypomesus transpacificus TaxID=137520 RepID=UPI001F080D81|nr:G1/S-specific cyclin-E2 [Hypomesus transpacificus]